MSELKETKDTTSEDVVRPSNEVKESSDKKDVNKPSDDVKEKSENKADSKPSEEIKNRPETVSYVQSKEIYEQYNPNIKEGDNVPQPPDGNRFVTSSKSMDEVLKKANDGATEDKKEEINSERDKRLIEEWKEKPWEHLQGSDSLEDAETKVPKKGEEPECNPTWRVEDNIEIRNILVEKQLGKEEGSLGDEKLIRRDVPVNENTVIEKPKPDGGELTNNGRGVEEGVDEYVLKSPETHHQDDVSRV